MRKIPDMKTAAEIINALDGSTTVSALLNVPMTTIASWKARNSIPAQHWTAIIRLMQARGKKVTLEQLAKLREAKAAEWEARAS